MTSATKIAIMQKALYGFKKYSANNKSYTKEDAYVYALEELDTGYNLTMKEDAKLKQEVERFILKNLNKSKAGAV